MRHTLLPLAPTLNLPSGAGLHQAVLRSVQRWWTWACRHAERAERRVPYC